jgi:uncharacterized oligopeptide transporter (OPT) family protein
MRPGIWVFGLAALWLVLFVLSFVMAAVTEPTGDSFVRGMNRIGVLLGWQFAALIAAIAALVAALSRPRPRSLGVRLAGYGPLSLMLLEVVAVVGITAFVYYTAMPSEPPPARPATQPASPAMPVP